MKSNTIHFKLNHTNDVFLVISFFVWSIFLIQPISLLFIFTVPNQICLASEDDCSEHGVCCLHCEQMHDPFTAWSIKITTLTKRLFGQREISSL